MKDSYRHKGLRAKLVSTLRAKGIQDRNVLAAINLIPRHYFLDKAFEEWAYKDNAFPIGSGQTISQPYTVARQTELLQLNGKCKVLEIGTGSGYQAAIISALGAKIYTIERQEDLYIKTSKFLNEIGFNRIRTLFGDGYAGAPKFTPFNRIIITAATSTLPDALFNQLAVNGLMVFPKGDSQHQIMTRIIKTSETSFEEETFGKYSFVPFLQGIVETT